MNSEPTFRMVGTIRTEPGKFRTVLNRTTDDARIPVTKGDSRLPAGQDDLCRAGVGTSLGQAGEVVQEVSNSGPEDADGPSGGAGGGRAAGIRATPPSLGGDALRQPPGPGPTDEAGTGLTHAAGIVYPFWIAGFLLGYLTLGWWGIAAVAGLLAGCWIYNAALMCSDEHATDGR